MSVSIDFRTAARATIERELVARVNRLNCPRCHLSRPVTADETADMHTLADLGALAFTTDCSPEFPGHHLVPVIDADQPLFGVEIVDAIARRFDSAWTYVVDRDLVNELEAAK